MTITLRANILVCGKVSQATSMTSVKRAVINLINPELADTFIIVKQGGRGKGNLHQGQSVAVTGLIALPFDLKHRLVNKERFVTGKLCPAAFRAAYEGRVSQTEIHLSFRKMYEGRKRPFHELSQVS